VCKPSADGVSPRKKRQTASKASLTKAKEPHSDFLAKSSQKPIKRSLDDAANAAIFGCGSRKRSSEIPGKRSSNFATAIAFLIHLIPWSIDPFSVSGQYLADS
jgi:hypothetical protein